MIRNIKQCFITSLLIFLLFLNNSCTENKTDKMEWWKKSKFGMFIHWGLYAVPAGIYNGKETDHIGEWIMFNENIPIEEYEKYADEFNPIEFNAKEWVSLAKKAGMKYIVITSKHHDGFCLWDSRVSDYNIVDRASYKKDILKQLADECKQQEIKLCFYYSIWDWHHPKAILGEFDEYYKDYLVPQIKELLTEFGDIGIMWFDGEWISAWSEDKGIELYNKIISIQPNTIVNNRIGNGRSGMEGLTKENAFAADYDTPEQEVPDVLISDRDWETCMTMNDTWGYKKNDLNWKTPKELIFKLVDITAKGGNFLLNIGPKADGTFPEASVERLKIIGDWMEVNSEAIYETKPYRKFWENESIRYTSSLDDQYLYAIVSDLSEHEILLKEINIKNESKVKLLGYDEQIIYEKILDNILIKVPNDVSKNVSVEGIVVFRIEQTPFINTPNIIISEFENSRKIVEMVSDEQDVEIRYTIDGSIPDLNSKRFNNPIAFNKPVILKAKTIKKGYASSLTVTKIIDVPREGVNGINYKYYEGNNWILLPEFSKLKSKNEGQINDFSIEKIKMRADQYAIKFASLLKIPRAGEYKFYLESDDGSRLIIDDRVVIDNDGSHSVIKKQNSSHLTSDYHKIELQYFEDSEGEVLNLYFSSEEIPTQKIPLSFLYIKRE